MSKWRFRVFELCILEECYSEHPAAIKSMIPYGRQTISQQDVDAVVAVLRSDFLTQGPVVPKFESAIADYCQVPHAVAVNSATSALHIACLALGVGPGDVVWTSPNTFVASANCARYCGASVDFVDIDPVTYNMCSEKLAEKLEQADRSGTLPKVVIPVHFAGQPCDMAAIHGLSQRYGFKIIEDASHAIGARYRTSVTGDCTYCDITVFSFHPVKIITTAEGGMATTKSPALARRMQLLRSHGITRDADELQNKAEGAWYYEQQILGFNYRMTDMQAALGLSQLRNLEAWITRRHEIADRYDQMLADLPMVLPKRQPNSSSALHLYPVQVANRRDVFDSLRRAGVGVNVHYIPVHLQPDFHDVGQKRGDLPVAESYYSRALSLPIFSALSQEQLQQIVGTVRNTLHQ
jgi:UDP-4-amino-4,6-dideoxy-N-acetyl-beta-L-altrosamine transaminase